MQISDGCIFSDTQEDSHSPILYSINARVGFKSPNTSTIFNNRTNDRFVKFLCKHYKANCRLTYTWLLRVPMLNFYFELKTLQSTQSLDVLLVILPGRYNYPQFSIYCTITAFGNTVCLPHRRIAKVYNVSFVNVLSQRIGQENKGTMNMYVGIKSEVNQLFG